MEGDTGGVFSGGGRVDIWGAGKMTKEEIITEAIEHRQGRRGLAQAMVKPRVGKHYRVYHPCNECGWHTGKVVDECDERSSEGDCWCPAGAMGIWDEVKG